jgi:hypothetical protein
MDTDTKFQLKAFVTQIADSNYYNDVHKIIRVQFKDNKYDFKYMGGHIVPNPTKHIALIITSEEALGDAYSIIGDRENFLPGIIDSMGNLTNLSMGVAYILSKDQEISRTNPSAGGAGMAISKTNMFDLEKVAIAIAPPLDKDYTNTEKDPNLEDKSVGIFMNNDGTILIKSKGSSITMGEEGIYIGGNVHWESAAHTKEWMMDNTLADFIPSTIVTFPLAIKEIPNIAKFAQIAEGARKVRSVVESISKAIGVVS